MASVRVKERTKKKNNAKKVAIRNLSPAGTTTTQKSVLKNVKKDEKKKSNKKSK